jgi:hypothetical protein
VNGDLVELRAGGVDSGVNCSFPMLSAPRAGLGVSDRGTAMGGRDERDTLRQLNEWIEPTRMVLGVMSSQYK